MMRTEEAIAHDAEKRMKMKLVRVQLSSCKSMVWVRLRFLDFNLGDIVDGRDERIWLSHAQRRR